MKILTVNFAPVSIPFRGGGDVRYYNIYKNLAKINEVILIDFTWLKNEEIIRDTNLKEIKIKKSFFSFLSLIWLQHFLKIDNLTAVITTLIDSRNKEYRKSLRTHNAKSAILISEFPFLFSSLKKLGKNQLLIYHAHNVEFHYQEIILGNSFIGKLLLYYVYCVEKKACYKSDIIFVTSELDRKELSNLYRISPNKVFVIPNGVDSKEITFCSIIEKEKAKEVLNLKEKKVILFCGNRHLPNVRSLEYIVFDLAPKMDNFVFIIFGQVSEVFLEQNTIEGTCLFPVDLCLDNYSALGKGWYDLHYSKKHKAFVRLTKKDFSFFIKCKDIDNIFLNLRASKKIKGEIFFNNLKIGELTANRNWRIFKYDVKDCKEKNEIKIILHKTHRPLFSLFLTECGIAVKELGFYSNGYLNKLDLNSLCCNFIRYKNIIFYNQISESLKKFIFKAADFALNPVTLGAGTNVKMAEYMAAGIPIISTSLGTRGFEVEHKKHLIISELQDFKENIETLDKDALLYENIRDNAMRLANEKYDWKVIAEEINTVLQKRIDSANLNYSNQ